MRARNSLAAVAVTAALAGCGTHDAVEIGWDMTWNTGCSCVRYVGASRRIP